MIETKNIIKSFGDQDVLHGISADFYPGKTNLVIGKSGSGKTVFVKCMVGLMQPDQGAVLYDNRNFTAMSGKEKKIIRQEIGMLFQGGALFDSMTVAENIIFPLDMFTSLSKGEKKDRVEFCLERVELQDHTQKLMSEISGGMQRRVALARAIVLKPKYLFCDEPNSGLDPKTSRVIDELIQEITQEYNTITIINTHDMNSVMEIGDNILFLNKGRTEWQGNKSEVLHADNEELDDFIFASGFLQQAKKVMINK